MAGLVGVLAAGGFAVGSGASFDRSAAKPAPAVERPAADRSAGSDRKAPKAGTRRHAAKRSVSQ